VVVSRSHSAITWNVGKAKFNVSSSTGKKRERPRIQLKTARIKTPTTVSSLQHISWPTVAMAAIKTWQNLQPSTPSYVEAMTAMKLCRIYRQILQSMWRLWQSPDYMCKPTTYVLTLNNSRQPT